jgi:hypothetical protein
MSTELARAGDTDWTPELREAVLECVARGDTIRSTCEQLRISMSSLQRLRRGDTDFEARFAEAWDIGADVLEDAAQNRALGWRKQTYERDRKTGEMVLKKEETQASDYLLGLLLKARRPERFRETARIEVLTTPMTGKDLAASRAIGRIEGATEALEAVARLFRAAEDERLAEADADIIELEAENP